MIGDKKGATVNIQAICVDDKNRPNEIPTSKWVRKDKPYTIVEFVILNAQNRRIGVRLAEIDLSDCFPYLFFAIERFGLLKDVDMEEAQKAVDKLLEESKQLTIKY